MNIPKLGGYVMIDFKGIDFEYQNVQQTPNKIDGVYNQIVNNLGKPIIIYNLKLVDGDPLYSGGPVYASFSLQETGLVGTAVAASATIAIVIGSDDNVSVYDASIL